jgi:hypothetical protein
MQMKMKMTWTRFDEFEKVCVETGEKMYGLTKPNSSKNL